MAARRLIIIMLVLLGISTLLAAALPDRVRQAEDEQTESEASTAATETATTAKAEPNRSEVKYLTFSADKQKIFVVPLDEGDQLALTIESSADDLVEILELGYLDAVGPHNPATFDIFADRPGDYGIKLTETDRTIGRIEVSAAKAAKGPE